MDESEDEAQNPLTEENWMKQNNCKFIKYVIHHRHPMTPEQLKQKPFEEIFKNQHEKVYIDERDSIEDKEKSTTSSDKLEQDSESDITTEDEEETNTTETHQVHNVLNETIHDEKIHQKLKIIQYMMNMIHQKMKIQLKLKHLNNMRRTFMKQKSHYLQKHLKFLLYSTKQYIMKMIHQMTNLRLKLNHQKRTGSKKLENRTNSLLPNFKLNLKTEKLKGSLPIQQSNKYSNSRLILGE